MSWDCRVIILRFFGQHHVTSKLPNKPWSLSKTRDKRTTSWSERIPRLSLGSQSPQLLVTLSSQLVQHQSQNPRNSAHPNGRAGGPRNVRYRCDRGAELSINIPPAACVATQFRHRGRRRPQVYPRSPVEKDVPLSCMISTKFHGDKVHMYTNMSAKVRPVCTVLETELENSSMDVFVNCRGVRFRNDFLKAWGGIVISQ